MLFNSGIALATFVLAATTQAAALEERQSDSSNFGLSVTTPQFNISYLQTLSVYYANSSAYLGEIKYQSYSEPLVVAGADSKGSTGNGLSFLSIHSAPTGFQEMYLIPHQTQPVSFSVPHGSAPSGVRETGFSFNSAGNLLNNGLNLFYACQNAELSAMNTYQIWWWGAGKPNGVSCQGPIQLQQSDACARY